MAIVQRPPSALRLARRARGLSLERAAVAAGISAGWLRQVERDPTLLTDRVAQGLAAVLGVSAEELLAPRRALEVAP